MQAFGRSTQKLWIAPLSPRNRPPERPMRQERKGKDKGEPPLKKARR